MQEKGLIAFGWIILATIWDTITLPIRIIAAFLGAPYQMTNWAEIWEALLDDN
ncbi:MAG: hypothetical protein U9Q79_08400 [Candidatus Hydrogenedentes bacterium]|nr:hypothetical protein [Candidatus Hydrogenedentota bacterium]